MIPNKFIILFRLFISLYQRKYPSLYQYLGWFQSTVGTHYTVQYVNWDNETHGHRSASGGGGEGSPPWRPKFCTPPGEVLIYFMFPSQDKIWKIPPHASPLAKNFLRKAKNFLEKIAKFRKNMPKMAIFLNFRLILLIYLPKNEFWPFLLKNGHFFLLFFFLFCNPNYPFWQKFQFD